MRTRPLLLMAILACSTTGATCREAKLTAPPGKPTPAVAEVLDAAAPAPAAQIAGLDLSGVRPEVRADLARLLQENFAYCGCPKTLAACLGEPATCSCPKAARRMFDFLVNGYAQGAGTPELERELLEGFQEGWNAAPVNPPLDGLPEKGTPGAPLTVLEFADFRCGHCRAAFPVIEKLAAERPDVRIFYAYFPLGSGVDTPSVVAAEAAEEARVQGKFWPMARLLFENQVALEPENLLAYGKAAGLDVKKLAAALADHRHRARVLDVKKIGTALNVMSTPTLYVNGRPLGLHVSLESLKTRLDMESERGHCD